MLAPGAAAAQAASSVTTAQRDSSVTTARAAAQDGSSARAAAQGGSSVTPAQGGSSVTPARAGAPAAVRLQQPTPPAATPTARLSTRPSSRPGPGGEQKPADRAGSPVTIAVLLGAISLIPALLMMLTAFTRIVIVLGFTRSALNTNGIPPNQVLIGIALFLTFFVMAPVFSQINSEALQPYLKGEIDQNEAYDRGIEPLREFMLEQTRERDLALFVRLSDAKQPMAREDVPTTTLVPAFVLSELRTAFLIGFVIFIPFLVIDLVVSAALSSMGMVMLPPVVVSLPFKLLLFVAADGWYLVVSSLVQSFR